MPPLVRHGVGVLSAVAPDLAAKAAAELFFRTRRMPERAQAKHVMARAASFRVPFEGEALAAWSWGEGPTVLLVHGWNGRASQLAGFVDPLVAAGRRVVAFDHVGHGASTGTRTNILQMARAIGAVAASAGGASGLVAHSLGAAAATVALGDGLAVERVVLVAPPITPEPWFDGFARALGLDPRVAAATKALIERNVGRSMAALYGPAIAKRLRTPALIFHDRDDREVPIASGETLHYAWPGSRFVVTAGHGHRRILDTPGVHESARRFLGEAG